ncbi:archaeosortase/exosortase family protein, partial [Escherichia coli]|nr:archaeosortase/exosortase family protein [Escherichia coli]
MTDTSQTTKTDSLAKLGLTPGIFWLIVAVLSAGVFFQEGIFELLEAWQQPEYSHGPLIPVLSLLLFLRQLKTVPVNYGDVPDRWPGLVLLLVALMLGISGKMIEINDIVAYALILS